MLKKLRCLFRGHERGKCIYKNEDLAVYECGVCGAQYPVFSLDYHVMKSIEEGKQEFSERTAGWWLS